MINQYNRLASLSEYDSPDMNAENDSMPMGSDFANGPPGQMPSMQQQPPTNNAGMIADYPTPLLDQYRNYLQAGLPNPSNYKPGFGRKLLAGLGSLGTSPEQGMMYQEHMLNGPYNQAVQNYFLKGKMLGEGANVEEKQIANKRGIAAAEEHARIAQERADVYAKEQESKDLARQNAAQAAIDKLQSHVDEVNSKLDLAERDLQRKQGDTDALLKFKDAQLQATIAKTNLEHAVALKKANDLIEFHKAQAENMKQQRADYEGRTKLWQEYNKDRLAGKDVTKYTFDQQGNITGKVETQSLPNTGQPKVNQQQVVTPNVTVPNNDRDKATKYLQDHNKPVTEANIKYLLDNKGKW